jgi:putative NIF3 family GTP cyclohydrolase 1 type 2
MTGDTAYTARDVGAVFESIAPIGSGVAGDELGFVHGDPDVRVSTLACLWQVESRSIRLAAACGAKMLICHESIWLPRQTSSWYDGPDAAGIHANAARRRLLDEHQLVVYRSHSNWDALPVDGVPDQAVAALGIAGLEIAADQRFFKVHRLPRPESVAELGRRAADGLAFPHVRVFGDAGKRVTRFAFLIGGFGENQYHMPQAAMELGAEAIVIGEMSEFIVVAALEMGMPVIETLHSISEMPAIRRQAEILGQRLPGLPVYFVPSGAHAMTTGATAVRVSG